MWTPKVLRSCCLTTATVPKGLFCCIDCDGPLMSRLRGLGAKRGWGGCRTKPGSEDEGLALDASTSDYHDVM